MMNKMSTIIPLIFVSLFYFTTYYLLLFRCIGAVSSQVKIDLDF